jgi:exopolyphosphatase / guanosine-5'-triphosphate,3'-diphosphate pyrophosphatase
VKRLAAIDCGTNSIRLLVVEIEGNNLKELHREMIIIRLGEGVDEHKRFSDAALIRLRDACGVFQQVIKELNVSKTRFIATSASRDVSNRAEFLEIIDAELSLTPDIISGDEEARLSFLGATGSFHHLPGPYLVIDIGGGSTEFVIGSDSVESSRSVNIGCVRMSERHHFSDPPTESELGIATKDIDTAIDEALTIVDVTKAQTIIGLAGSITTVAAEALHLSSYEREKIHGSQFSLNQIESAAQSLISMTQSERAGLGFMHPGRVDVIGAGALVLWRSMVKIASIHPNMPLLTVSEHDILDGIIYDLQD